MSARQRLCAVLVVCLGTLVYGLPAPQATAADPVTLSGTFASPGNVDLEYETLSLLSYPDEEDVDGRQTEPDGSYAFEIEPGQYWLTAEAEVRREQGRVRWRQHVDLTESRVVDFVGVPVDVNLVNQNGHPRYGRAELVCEATTDDIPSVTSTYEGAGQLALVGAAVPGGCDLEVRFDDGEDHFQEVTIDPVLGAEVTIVTTSVESRITGTLTTEMGQIVSAGVSVRKSDSRDSVVSSEIGPAGVYDVVVADPGTYTFSTWAEVDSGGPYSGYLQHEFEVEVDGDRDLALGLPETMLTVTLEDQNGLPQSGRLELSCRESYENSFGDEEEQRSMYSVVEGSGTIVVWGFPPEDHEWFENGCVLTVYPDSGLDRSLPVTLDPEGTNELTVVLDSFVISGAITGTDGVAATSGFVRATDLDLDQVTAQAPIGGDGTYSLDINPGTYQLVFNGEYEGGSVYRRMTVEVTEDMTINAGSLGVPVTVHLVDSDGQPEEGSVRLGCNNQTIADPDTFVTQITMGPADAAGIANLWAIPTDGPWACNILLDSPYQYYFPEIDADGGEFTMIVPDQILLEGGPLDSVDGDGVPDTLEAQAPNNGDGNSDGTPDYEQSNVTSLPANGSSDSADPYLTLVGPAGSTLEDVSTLDEGSVTTPPPAGVSLPAGLASFTITGLTPGSDAVVSVYPESTDDITGYAKYDPDSETWSILPAGRVAVFSSRVDVTLTDGGPGDADGVDNGEIVDPGGIAILPTGDTTPPVVTGTPTRAPNANGWYSSDVRIRWNAVDEGSGVAQQPASTLIIGQGDNLGSQSSLVCDLATPANCARGQVSGIKIDRTPPSLAIGGVTDGATYTLGAVPTATCTVTDVLSGPAGACSVSLTGGNANRVGVFTHTASATDRAGNRRTVTTRYRVAYRFDGFLQPINDPALSPGSAMSVFRKPSTIGVGFTLKSADGTVITPVSRPVWISPVRGARTSAAVNEASSSARASTGSTYAWRADRWQYDWSTRNSSAGYTYRLGVRLDDGTTHYVVVGVR